jgi:AraC family transcriptional regulator, L-rhamnose operon regulatory protein RhaS
MRRRGNVHVNVRFGREDGLPAANLGHLAHAGYAKAVTAGSWHTHEHPRLEIHYFVRGIVRCWVGPELYEVSGGDVLVVLPNTPHGGWLGVRPPAELYWIGILPWDPARGDHPFGLSLSESAAAHDALAHLAEPRLRVGDGLAAPFAALVASQRPRDGRSLFALRRAVLDVLGMVVDAASAPHAPSRSDVVRAGLDVIRSNLESPLSVPEVARRSGYGASYFVRAFHRQMGISPKEYYVRCRVLEACRRLAEGTVDITHTAHALGFASSQYFATAFKRVTGMSPTEYQLACAAAESPTPAERWPT